MADLPSMLPIKTKPSEARADSPSRETYSVGGKANAASSSPSSRRNGVLDFMGVSGKMRLHFLMENQIRKRLVLASFTYEEQDFI
jgi:hypothetical protein